MDLAEQIAAVLADGKRKTLMQLSKATGASPRDCALATCELVKAGRIERELSYAKAYPHSKTRFVTKETANGPDCRAE